MAVSVLLNGLGILGLTKGRCNSIRKRRKHKASFSIPIFNRDHVTEEPLHHIQDDVMSTAKLIGSNNSSTQFKSGPYVSNATTAYSLQTLSTEYGTTVTPTISPDDHAELGRINLVKIVNIRYWLWIGPHPITAVKHNLTLQVPVNTTFFSVMQRAAELASEYE